MKFNKKVVKKLAVVGMLVLSAGAVTACSPGMPSTEEIIDNNRNFTDYNSFKNNIVDGYPGNQKLKSYSEYVRKTRQFYEADLVNDQEFRKGRMWFTENQPVYSQFPGKIVKQKFSTFKDEDGKSPIDDADDTLNETTRFLSKLSKKNLDWQVYEKSAGYVLETSPNEVDSTKVKKALKFDPINKFKNVKIQFLIGKVYFDTREIAVSYDVVGDKPVHRTINFKFNSVRSIKVPSYIKEDARE